MKNAAKEIERRCDNCNVLITKCNGFVNSSDWLAERSPVRELCGKCLLSIYKEIWQGEIES